MAATVEFSSQSIVGIAGSPAEFAPVIEALSRLPQFKLIASATALSLKSQCEPKIVVSDASPDDLAGVRMLFPNSRLVVLTSRGEPNKILEALANGAQSFLLTSDSPKAVARAIQLVDAGLVVLSSSVANFMIGAALSTRPMPANRSGKSLTLRETEVLALVSKGNSDAEIAQILQISTRTAQQHMANVLRKFNARSRSEAVARLLGVNSTAPLWTGDRMP